MSAKRNWSRKILTVLLLCRSGGDCVEKNHESAQKSNYLFSKETTHPSKSRKNSPTASRVISRIHATAPIPQR